MKRVRVPEHPALQRGQEADRVIWQGATISNRISRWSHPTCTCERRL